MTFQESLGLFATDRTRWEDIASALRPRPVAGSEFVWFLTVVVGCAAVFVLLVYSLSRRDRRQAYASPTLLFWSLCRFHHLPLRDRWLLWRAARRQRLRDPARMFVDVERFREENLGPKLAAHPRLALLRQRLLGDAPPVAPVVVATVETSALLSGPNPLLPLQAKPTLDLGGPISFG